MKKVLSRMAIGLGVVVLLFVGLITYKVQGGMNKGEEIPTMTLDEIVADSEETMISSNPEASILATEEMFSERDLDQVVDLMEAKYVTLNDNEDFEIREEGVYVLSGNVENSTIRVNADDKAKVQLVLDGVTIINEGTPAIVVSEADKVFVTMTETANYLEVSGLYVPEGTTNVDAVIYSKSDLTLNGIGSLEIVSAKGNGITSKDDLKITGGSYNINADEDALEANDSIRVYDGDFNIVTNKDALHSENENDLSLGYIYIRDGNFVINSGDDAIRGTSIVQIDSGNITIETCSEGIEGSYIQINGGVIDLYSTDDGINATNKSIYPVMIQVNAGDINVVMSDGDTDGFDSNGDLTVNGGNITVTSGMAAFDVDGVISYNDGVVTVDGEEVDVIETQTIGIAEIFKSKFN